MVPESRQSHDELESGFFLIMYHPHLSYTKSCFAVTLGTFEKSSTDLWIAKS
jgi:hypothetical protein